MHTVDLLPLVPCTIPIVIYEIRVDVKIGKFESDLSGRHPFCLCIPPESLLCLV